MKFKEMAMVLQVNKEQRDELRQVLESLEEEGKICLSKRGKYCKGEAKRLQGTYRANQRGFGFVIIPEEDQDIFIGEDDAGGALDGDIVEVIITKASDRDGKRREGKIVKIVERGLTTVVGLYQKKGNKSYGFVIPDNQRILQDIFIPEGKSKEAVDGHKVVVELTSYGEKGRSPEGRIVEIIGHVNDPGTDIMSIVKGYDLPVEFPEKVLNQAERVSKPVSEADMQGRKDIRDWQMVTIDGEDAKDLDDALLFTQEEVNEMREGKGNRARISTKRSGSIERSRCSIEFSYLRSYSGRWWWRVVHEQHKSNYYAMFHCGVAYQLTGDKKYARYVADMLEAYARLYPTLGFHPVSLSPVPGRLFWQTLNESVWLVHTAVAYDCIYHTLSAKQRTTIEKNLFAPMADFIMDGMGDNHANNKTFNKMHNHATWATAAVGMIGFAMNREDYVNKLFMAPTKQANAEDSSVKWIIYSLPMAISQRGPTINVMPSGLSSSSPNALKTNCRSWKSSAIATVYSQKHFPR